MNEFWEQYDTDKNGVLEKEEFRVFLDETFAADEYQVESNNNMNQVLIDSKFEDMFLQFDKDGNGVISKEEMFEFLAQLFGESPQNINMEQVLRKESIMVKKKGTKK
jgi:Ca2+-binding EF-hand superfamily protein